MDGIRQAYSDLAEKVGEHCGLPMGLDGVDMAIAPKLKYATVFNTETEFQRAVRQALVNQWYSPELKQFVSIYRVGGKTEWLRQYREHPVSKIMETISVTKAWTTNAEVRALRKLRGLVSRHIFHHYLLTGTFLESSKRSGVFYIFRKLRPTLAIRGTEDGKNTKILCAMCLHPIGWYQGTWAGAMCPTDDVIAHLLLMRSDEHYFWRKSNQHPAWHPLADAA